jgi:hypothetical protein
MKRNIWSAVIGVMLFASSWVMPGTTEAVPSYARQTGKPCSGCHSIWPRLNALGRDFKLTGYTDVAEDSPRIVKDNLDLLRHSPLSLSVINLPYTKADRSDTPGERSETLIPAEVALFYAGRITPNIGAFIEPILAPDFAFEFAKIAAATRWGKVNIVGVAAGKMDVGGADPYNTIRFTAYHTINQPAIFSEPDALSGSRDLFSWVGTSNQGAVLYGKFFQTLYVAAGGFRGHASSDPADTYGRIAVELPLGAEANFEVGGFYYNGKEIYDHSDPADPLNALGIYQSKLTRSGADLQFQMESGPHIIDAVGVFMKGEDKDLDATPGLVVKFDGFYVEASYFFERQYGVTVGYDKVESTEDPSMDKKGPTFNLAYFPWLNTKIALEYSTWDRANSVTEKATNVLVHLYF